MTTRTFWLGGTFLWAAAAGCAASTTRSSALDDFSSQYAAVQCEWDARCGRAWIDERSVRAALADCPSQLGDAIEDYSIAALRGAIANGTVVYHPEHVGACLDGFAVDCGGGWERTCRDVFEGLIADGQPCDLDEQCADTSLCTRDTAGTCPVGTCAHRSQVGEPCALTGASGCDSGLWCGGAEGAAMGTCQERLPVGAACRTTDRFACGFVASCVPSALHATDGTCTAGFSGVGQTCGPVGCAPNLMCQDGMCRAARSDGTCLYHNGTPSVDCPTGQTCDATFDVPEGHCQPDPTLGQPCTLVCVGGSRCASTGGGEHVCALPRRIGDACTFAGECLSERCDAGVCAATRLCAE